MDSCAVLAGRKTGWRRRLAYLHGATQAVDAVVGSLWFETTQGQLHHVVLLGNQVIGSVWRVQSARGFSPRNTGMRRRPRAAYLNPSCLYPAAFTYQSAMGLTIFSSHGRLRTKAAPCGADMVAVVAVSVVGEAAGEGWSGGGQQNWRWWCGRRRMVQCAVLGP